MRIKQYPVCLIISFLSLTAPAQISIPVSRLVNENFNAMATGTSLPSNWRMSTAGTGAIATYAAGVTTATEVASSGSPATGGRYNWSTTAGTDRAIGFLTSGSYASPNAIMAFFQNNTGGTVTSMTISFQVERYVVNSAAFNLSFFSSTDGTSWTARSGGDISPAVFKTAANSFTFNTPQTFYKTITVSGLNIANGGSFYLKWLFETGSANSQGIGLDEVKLYANAAIPVMSANLGGQLTVDANSNNIANPDDEITYSDTIKNSGSGNATATNLTNPPPTNTTLVANTIRSSALAVDDSYTTAVNTTLSSGNVVTNDFGLPSITLLSFGPTANAAATVATGTGISDNGGSLTVNADGTFSYMPPTGFVGNDRFAYVITASPGLPNNTGYVTIAVGSAVSGSTDNYNDIIGNISINPTGSNNLLSNDNGDDIAVSAVNGNAASVGASILTGNGGNLTVNANGDFTYNPAPGYEGTDNFTYTIDNGFGTPATVTVNLNVTGMVWFIDNNAAVGDGRLSSPFNSITAYNAASGPNAPAANDNIFVYESATGYSGAFTLLSGQRLIGQDATATLSSITGLSPNATYSAAFPAMNTGGNPVTLTSSGNAVTLGSGNTVRGLTIGNTTGSKISGSSFGTLTVNDVALTGTGQALNLSNGTAAATFSSVASTSSSAQGISLTNIGGTLTSTGGTTITTPTGIGIDIQSSAGTINLGATTVTKISAGTGVNLGGAASGNSGNVVFTSLGITTSNGTGLLATNNSGQITVTDPNAAISATGGPALNISQASGTTTVDMDFSGLSSTTSTSGAIMLTNVAGTITGAGGSITGATTAPVNISGGTVSLTYSGGITVSTNIAMVNVSGGHATGTLAFNTGTLSATNGTGLQFDNADGTYNFNGTTTLNGGDAGIDITNGSQGTFTFGSLTTITDPSGTSFNLNNSNANVTYSGNITDNSGYAIDINTRSSGTVTFQTGSITSTGTGLRVQNSTGGTINFNSPVKSITATSSNGVQLATNSGGTINFGNGGLVVNTTSSIGISISNASGPGCTVNVTGTGNIINSTSATALNMANATIGASNLNFQSISSGSGSAPATGISLNNTGSTGGLVVTGLGITPGSGGTIQNTINNGINLQNTFGVSLNSMNITNCLGSGIFGDDLTNFSISNSTLTNNSNTFDGTEANMRFNELLGTCSFANCTFSGSTEDEVRITPTSGTLTNLIISGCTFGPNSVATGGHGLSWIATSSAVGTINITGSTFTDIRSTGAIMNVTNTATGTLNVSSSNFINSGVAVTLQSDADADLNFNVSNNTTTNCISNAIQLVAGSTSTSSSEIHGTISGNTIGNGTPNSGSRDAYGIAIDLRGDQSSFLNISGNNVRNADINTVWITSADFGTAGPPAPNAGKLDLTFANNTLGTPDDDSPFPFFFNYTTLIDVRHTTRCHADIQGNTIAAGVGGAQAIRVRQRDQSIFGLERLNGGSGTGIGAATVQAHITSENNGCTSNATIVGGFTGIPNGTVIDP